jgi:F0F1-type ATP synthase delta subunit
MAKKIHRAYAEALLAACEGATGKAQLTSIAKAFVHELAERGMVNEWRGIEREIDGAWKRAYGASTITVVSAHPLTPSLRKEIESLAPHADLVERVDERLMGGVVIRVDDRRIDASVAGSLQRLKSHLLSVS